MADLTIPEIVKRMRLDAANHRQLADGIDAKASDLENIHESYSSPTRIRFKRTEPTIETLVATIKSRGNVRAVHLADQFGVPVETVQRIVDGAKDRIRNKGAGWLALIEDSAANNPPAEEIPV